MFIRKFFIIVSAFSVVCVGKFPITRIGQNTRGTLDIIEKSDSTLDYNNLACLMSLLNL